MRVRGVGGARRRPPALEGAWQAERARRQRRRAEQGAVASCGGWRCWWAAVGVQSGPWVRSPGALRRPRQARHRRPAHLASWVLLAGARGPRHTPRSASRTRAQRCWRRWAELQRASRLWWCRAAGGGGEWRHRWLVWEQGGACGMRRSGQASATAPSADCGPGGRRRCSCSCSSWWLMLTLGGGEVAVHGLLRRSPWLRHAPIAAVARRRGGDSRGRRAYVFHPACARRAGGGAGQGRGLRGGGAGAA